MLVEAGHVRLLIDAGLAAETILKELGDASGSCCSPASLDAILLTHEHDDHMKGAVAVARATGAVIWVNEPTLRAARGALAGAAVEVFRTGVPFGVGSASIAAFPVPHDAAEPVGFTLAAYGARVAVACDLGDVTGSLVEHARGADLLVIEANYDLRLLGVSAYPWFLKNRIMSAQGHLSNEGAARVAAAAANGKPQTVQLVHLSEVNNLAPLARDVVRGTLAAGGHERMRVEVVRPNAAGPWWNAPLADAGAPEATGRSTAAAPAR